MPVPVVDLRRNNAARLQYLIQPNAVEQFQRGGMIGAGARHLVEVVVLAERLDQRHWHALLRQRQRQAEADRSCADNHNTIGNSIAHVLCPSAELAGSGSTRSASS